MGLHSVGVLDGLADEGFGGGEAGEVGDGEFDIAVVPVADLGNVAGNGEGWVDGLGIAFDPYAEQVIDKKSLFGSPRSATTRTVRKHAGTGLE